MAAVDFPVSADLEDGYGDTAQDVGRTVGQAAELGAVGANIEDAAGGALFGIEVSVARIAAARAAAPSGAFVLNARTDTYFVGFSGDVFAQTVDPARRYLEVGADCVFVPGVVQQDTIRRLAAALPGPLNVVAGLANTIDAPTLFSLGVKRVSLGGSMARASRRSDLPPGRRSACRPAEGPQSGSCPIAPSSETEGDQAVPSHQRSSCLRVGSVAQRPAGAAAWTCAWPGPLRAARTTTAMTAATTPSIASTMKISTGPMRPIR